MGYLPPLERGVAVWRLPMTEQAARRLVVALLSDEYPWRVQQLAALLREEPSLVLWSVCRARRWQDRPPVDVAAIATWLAEQGLDVLQWNESESPSGSLVDGDLLQKWAELAGETVAIAVCAARLAGEAEGGPVYLCGLLHASPDWLQTCGPPWDAANGLPDWLAAWIQQICEQPPADSSPWFVAQAIRCLRAPRNASAEGRLGAAEVAAAAEIAEVVRCRWLARSEDWERLLPPLMRKLQRLEQLEREFHAALEREKLEALKELAYGASHEINNPLANISTRAQTLMREETDPERRRKLAVINAQAFRAHEMISDMMLFARPPALEREAVELTALVDGVIRELREEAAAQGTMLERASPDVPLTISADPSCLAVALKALCTNSLEALRAGGRVEIAVRTADASVAADGGPWVEILVRDDGPGIPPEIRRHLFDPYFSGREAGRGLGLGLSKCWRIVTEHGGRIQVESHPRRETTFTVQLPAG